TGLTQPSTGGTLTISGTTEVRYTPTANFCSVTPLTFTYRTEDVGNATSNIATGSFIVNCIPPENPTIIALGGDNQFPFTISDATPIISGTGEANTIVNFYTISGVLIATGTTDSNGEFAIPILQALPEGEFTYTITLTDIYGYESSGTTLQFLLDTTAPGVPSVQPLPLVSITGSVSISGSTSPNSSIEILSASGNVLCSTQSTGTGFYSCGPLIPPPLTGTHSLIIRACDSVITPNCSSNSSTQLVVDTLLGSTGAAHPGSNGSSSASSSSFTPSSTPNVSPSVFAPLFTIPENLPEILESAPDIFKDNFLKLLPTQTLVNLDSSVRDGYSVYNLSERVTPYVCPQIVQMYKEDELLANDIPTVDFTDDVKALIMFRGLEKNERVIGQKYSEYQKFGIALNDESYEPYRSITRAEFVKMLVRSLSCRYMFVGTETKFSDVSRDMWYAEYIAFAVENEWINGYSDGTFRPDALITRAEAAKILARSIKLRIPPRTISTFIDVPNSSVFVPYIESLRDNNIINGKTLTTFEPNSHIVRTEASRIIYKTFLGGGRKISEK
ncbi:S-layer homology domain-containing protein, partial [Candidatus Gracilibacteria bacterium]|nr:S-layer homology domain-containing protein [Candidatus Gracilibacteria bacterium]